MVVVFDPCAGNGAGRTFAPGLQGRFVVAESNAGDHPRAVAADVAVAIGQCVEVVRLRLAGGHRRT
ncbi:hypothetical protein D9M72_630830 [compost metagenome]